MTALAYHLSHSTGTVDLELSGDRFVVRTKGNGLADRLRVIDVSVAELVKFAVVGTVAAQNLGGTRAQITVDNARTAELLFSYRDGGSTRKKRLFVNGTDPAFSTIVERLAALRPDASLVGRTPSEAYGEVGVLSPQQGLLVVLAVLLGIPALIAVVYALVAALS
jgi:hypothetical protein